MTHFASLSATAPLAFGAEANRLSERAALFGVVRRNHRIIGRKTPPRAVLVGGHCMVGHQMPLEHLLALSTVEANDIVGFYGGADRRLRLRLRLGSGSAR